MFRRALLVLALALLPLSDLAVASAATPPPRGHLTTARLDVFDHRVVLTGWAYDPAHPAASVAVVVRIDGRYAGTAPADRPSPRLDRGLRIAGRHVFRFARAWRLAARVATITARPPAGGAAVMVGRAAVRHMMPPAGQRIITVAKRYVGRSPYVWGGASPRGFDCSGYTKYVYAKARVRRLPHNAEQQRHVRGMRRISRRAARAGDLIFYLSGGYAYHVAIYGGHGTQYAAVAPGLGVRHQRVPAHGVQYRTVLH
jgi:cell wall-associated NlpC family hydrolase